jgi:germination protein M
MRKLSLLLAAALLFGLCACSFVQGAEEDSLSLWFVSQKEHENPELKSYDYEGAADVPSMMEALLTGPAITTGLRSAIPEGTRLLSWSVKGDLAKIDLSEPYDTLEGVSLTLADYCITLTLTQLENVKNVHITVNGRDVSRRSKQIFSASDVVLSGAEEEPVELTAALCFRRIGGNELGEELRVFRLTESQSATLAVLQALLSGPTEPGLQALLPQGVEVYSARVEAGVCYADFSAALLTDIPVSLEQQRLVLDSVVDSLQSLGHVQAVQFMVEGEPLSYYGQVDVSQPMS